MRVLSLDIGQVRCGIAISDPTGRVASPVCVLPSGEVIGCARSFKRLLDDWQPDLLLAGLPLTLSGSSGGQAQRIRAQAQQIADTSGLPLEFVDERLSSQEAKRMLREEGLTERDMRGKIDMIAASIFLQAWRDRQRAKKR